MASWFSWNEPYYRSPQRDPVDVATDTLMLELSWQTKEAERQHRERESEYRRLKTGVDYSWLANTPRSSYSISTAEKLGLEDLCSKVPPAGCGLVILKFREAMRANEPEVQEVSSLFRSVLQEVLENLQEEQQTQRLSRQWNNRRAMSVSLMNFRSRIKINPFGSATGLAPQAGATAAAGAALSDLKTVSEDVERGAQKERVWSVPDFRYKGTSSSEVI